MSKFTNFFFVIVLIIGFFVRFFNLSSVPPSLNWDEVSFGYNAYSILETGRDEFGRKWPLYFQSLGDNKLPVYMYLTVISIKFFGFTDFAVRFPSALLGFLLIILVYLLAIELFKKKSIALFSALTIAILPWNIQFSRMATEANVGLFFLVFGILTFIWSFRKNALFLTLSSLSFSMTLYTYLSFRVITPLVIIVLVLCYLKEVKHIFFTKKLTLAISILIFLLFAAYVARDMAKTGHVRFTGTSIFNIPDAYTHNDKQMMYDATLGINLTRRLLHDSKLVTHFEQVSRGYLTHFSPDFLFFDLGQKHHHAPRVGLIYLWMIIFLIAGFYALLKRKDKNSFLVLALLLLSPLPPAVTWDIPHAIRSITMTIPISLMTGIGIYAFLSLFFKKRLIFYVLVPVFSFLVLANFGYFLHQYFIHMPHERSDKWIWGYKEAVEFTEANKNSFRKIVVSTNLEWPHIFFLYYSAHDPKQYLLEGGTVSGYYNEQNNSYDKYEFRKFGFKSEAVNEGFLFVGNPKEFPDSVKPIKVINYKNGEPAIYIVESF